MSFIIRVLVATAVIIYMSNVTMGFFHKLNLGSLRFIPQNKFLYTAIQDKTLLKSTSIQLETSSAANNKNPSSQKLFRFGVIADIQYADSDDAMNFQGTKIRRYRNSLSVFENAINTWNSQKTQADIDVPFTCSIILGDILDGKTSLLKQQQYCYDKLSTHIQRALYDIYYCFGNHCHYSFPRSELYSKFLCNSTKFSHDNSFNDNSIGGNCSSSKLYYDWSPFPGWRFVTIDSYDVSIIGASTQENLELANSMLKEHNPNDLTVSGTWFDNLDFHRKRWVPYNGGVSQMQLNWFRRVLNYTLHNNEKVIVFSHQPIYAPDIPQSVIWNSEELLELVHEYGTVCLWMAGHDHDGQYQIDDCGVHHLVPPAPIEALPGDKTFGHIDVYNDKLVLNWNGRIPLPNETTDSFPIEMRVN